MRRGLPGGANSSNAPSKEKTFGGPDKDNSEEDENLVGRSSASGKVRRVACDICRERKVRCDRVQPTCGRCARLGHHCRYASSRKFSNLDIPQALVALHQRLIQTEARLDLAHNANPVVDPSVEMNHGRSAWPDILPPAKSSMPLLYPESNGSSSNGPTSTTTSYPLPDDLGLDSVMMQHVWNDWDHFGGGFDNMDVTMDSSLDMFPNEQVADSRQTVPQDAPLNSLSEYDTSGNITAQAMAGFHDKYFSVIHPMLSFIDRERLVAALGTPPVKPGLNSLNHAIAMIGAGISGSDYKTIYICYGHARRYLEESETEESEPGSLSVRAIQALVLITWYEFKGQDFTRAWMSLGRLLRLARVLGLDRVDSAKNVPLESSGFRFPLPDTDDWVELEERRRTFWVAFILDAYASARTKSPMTLRYNEISTFLPSIVDSPSPAAPASSIGASNFMDPAEDSTSLSFFAGMAAMTAMVGLCLEHLQAAREDDVKGGVGYDFWVQHFEIDKVVVARSRFILEHTIEPLGQNDIRQILLRLNLCSVNIYLHEIAIAEAMKRSLPDTMTIESKNRCRASAVEIATVLRQTEHLDYLNTTLFKQMNTFAMWSISSATRVLSSLLESNTKEDTDEAVAALQVLHTTMDRLEDKSTSWDALIHDVSVQLTGLNSTPNSSLSNSTGS